MYRTICRSSIELINNLESWLAKKVGTTFRAQAFSVGNNLFNGEADQFRSGFELLAAVSNETKRGTRTSWRYRIEPNQIVTRLFKTAFRGATQEKRMETARRAKFASECVYYWPLGFDISTTNIVIFSDARKSNFERTCLYIVALVSFRYCFLLIFIGCCNHCVRIETRFVSKIVFASETVRINVEGMFYWWAAATNLKWISKYCLRCFLFAGDLF